VPASARRPLLTDEHYRLGALLRSLREESGLTQVDVAKRLGRDQSYVSKYESAERRIDLIQLLDVCRALGAPPAEVLARFERETPTRRSR
jgi:transcriptional regulator with XRE-family HTH domain